MRSEVHIDAGLKPGTRHKLRIMPRAQERKGLSNPPPATNLRAGTVIT